MRIALLCVIFIVLCSCQKEDSSMALSATESTFLGEIAWVKTIGGSGEETAQAITKTVDGGFAIVGFTNSTDGIWQGKTSAVNDYFLLKVDTGGGIQWHKTYGGSKDDRGQSLAQTSDGGYVLTGYAMSDDGDGSLNNGFHDNWVLKVDALGELQWEKSFGFSGHDHSYDIIESSTGGYFFTGFLDITSARADGNTEKSNSLTRHGVGEFWGTKIDANGTMQWRGYFGGTNNDRAHAVVESNDGGYVMAGFSESDDYDISSTQGSYDFWIVKTDAFGNMVWEQSFGGAGIEIAYDIAKTNDGGYVVAGNTFSTDGDIAAQHGESDFWLIKVDDFGTMQWEHTYGGSGFDAAQAVVASKDGGYFVVGNSKSTDGDSSTNNGENDIWIIKTDTNGALVWQKSLGGSGLDFAFDVLENDDGSIIVVGETSSTAVDSQNTNGKSDIILIKLN